ncbi:MAG: cupin domain-containing protein [Verrucomicrobiota bacterium]|nr:cupin domain-containing protein [Verrucomicrobiota bacterium]
MTVLLLATTCTLHVNENLTIYSLVPPEANQGWKLELFRLAEPITPHYHRLQRQFILVADGKIDAFYGTSIPTPLQTSDLVSIDPGILHSLTPQGPVYFFSLDFPGFNFPEDVFYDLPPTPIPWVPPVTHSPPPLDPKYFGPRIELENYAVYELVAGSSTNNKWSVALLEIKDSPRHFHRIEKEVFVVVHGVLDIEIDGLHHILSVGESITIPPNHTHQLKSVGKESTRVLCFSFPAFTPSDMYCID